MAKGRTTMTVIQDIPRAALGAVLWVGRLPLTVAELVRGIEGEWPPALVFDGFAAGVRELAGGVLHDDELVHAARLERARVSALRKASELDAVASATREQADAEFREERVRDEQQRENIAQQTRARAFQLEQAKAKKAEQVAAKAKDRKQSVRQTEAQTKEQMAKQERATRAARLRAERKVLKDERRAVAATGAAVDADRELQETKAARRSTRPET
jgi:hypothetical protein